MHKLKFRYNTSGNWYKGNTHIHSTFSDGTKTIEELDEMYHAESYDFIYLTDHWHAPDFKNSDFKMKLLWLDGSEFDGRDENGSLYHIVFLGNGVNLIKPMTIEQALAEGRNKNALIVFAHPAWSGNSTEDALRYDFDAVEIYNNVSEEKNGKGYSQIHLEKMLLKNPKTLCIASDDAHMTESAPFWNGGWIVTNLPELSENEIAKALKTGNYYSSTGPEFYDIRYEKGLIKVRTSPVKNIRLVGPEYLCRLARSTEDSPLSSYSFEPEPEWPYSYLEIEDFEGKKAWSNNLFIR